MARYTNDIHKWWNRTWCWHRPERSNYYDFKCQKCGFCFSAPYDWPGVRKLWWFITGRLPK